MRAKRLLFCAGLLCAALLMASCGGGGSATGGGGGNSAPVALDRSFNTTRNTPVAVPLSASDADGDTLTYFVVTNPASGTLSGAAPNLTYTPATCFTGSDGFTYRAIDGKADSNTATVTVTVAAPGATGGLTYRA
ncbi:MAG: Ig-like domain-containing protein, partial [SAR324 cluster bacterium]|nr:Ig-like domain-containing protein [SAR324 cluster bacterium]